MGQTTAARKRLAESADEAAGKDGLFFDGDLLPEDGADGKLESIPAARHAQPRFSIDSARQACVGA
jgi:hypothetical protein